MPNIMMMRELRPELPVLFTHVPKTGGSTITRGMAAIVGPDGVAGISSAKPDERRQFLENCRASGTRYVYGHFGYPDASPLFDEANYIISLRHPLDRILSFYFMMLRAKSDFAVECAREVAGAGFAKFHDRLVRRRKQDNLICRYLCGKPDYQQALEILRSRYALAWDTEGADLTWRALHRSLRGEDPRSAELVRRNDAPVADRPEDLAAGARPKDYSTFLPPENVRLVEEANAEDVLLFDWFIKNANSDLERPSDQERPAADVAPTRTSCAS